MSCHFRGSSAGKPALLEKASCRRNNSLDYRERFFCPLVSRSGYSQSRTKILRPSLGACSASTKATKSGKMSRSSQLHQLPVPSCILTHQPIELYSLHTRAYVLLLGFPSTGSGNIMGTTISTRFKGALNAIDQSGHA